MEEKNRKETYLILAQKLKGIYRIPKCEGCSCFVDTFHEFEKALNQEDGELVGEIWREIQDVSAKAKTTHGCLGCNPCYPVPISNKLSEVKDKSLEKLPILSCASETQGNESWPVEPGDYIVGNKEAPVAISTLASESLPERFALERGLFHVAIIGKTETENIGIEKIIKNTITNPRIRVLVLAGKEASGHFPADALRCLVKEGIDPQGRIQKAKGIKPIMRNVNQAQVDQFRRQVSLIDLEGEEDTQIIHEELEKRITSRLEAYERAAEVKPVPRIQAVSEERFQIDGKGFFIIHLNPEENKILLEHYENKGVLTQVIEGDDPRAIYFTVIRRGLISRLDHACYLGKELERARLSLKYRFPYVQDGAGVRPVGETP